MSVSEHAVVIAGGGPTGMMLAAELALANVDVAFVERRPDHVLTGSRAGGFHSRTIEVLDQRGIADRFLAEGQVAQASMIGTTVLDMSDFPTRHPYSLGIWQSKIEQILADWIAELPVRIYYGSEVTGFARDDAGVDVAMTDGRSLLAQYLVGCDGGRSVIRKAAGIEFPGWDPSKSNLIAEAEMSEEPELGIRRDAVGIHGIGRLEYEVRDGEVVYKDEGPVRVMVSEQQPAPSGEPTLGELSEALVAVYGTDFGIHSPTSIARFTDMTRQAASYRAGRVLLAGDSAHVHYPAGGQGLSLGVQDAVNLGWKLAQVVNGISPDSLLDTYQDERHPVAARALRHTMAQTALQRQDERSKAWPSWSRSWRRWMSCANGSPESSPGLTSTTSSARATRCSDVGCRTWTSSPPTARCGSSSCCTTADPSCSTSASVEPSTSLHGPTGFSWSMRATKVSGSSRCSGRSALPPLC
jgi:2-polyprenyl-6-methoxyphenol hydroxylase-like FAD-dependent oxidoreductase